jgi:hypothetical protein
MGLPSTLTRPLVRFAHGSLAGAQWRTDAAVDQEASP